VIPLVLDVRATARQQRDALGDLLGGRMPRSNPAVVSKADMILSNARPPSPRT
jgi:hypothetical protein